MSKPNEKWGNHETSLILPATFIVDCLVRPCPFFVFYLAPESRRKMEETSKIFLKNLERSAVEILFYKIVIWGKILASTEIYDWFKRFRVVER